MCDSLTKATSDDTDFSTSLANLREWFNQAKVRSKTQRLGMICQLPLIFSEISTGHQTPQSSSLQNFSDNQHRLKKP